MLHFINSLSILQQQMYFQLSLYLRLCSHFSAVDGFGKTAFFLYSFHHITQVNSLVHIVQSVISFSCWLTKSYACFYLLLPWLALCTSISQDSFNYLQMTQNTASWHITKRPKHICAYISLPFKNLSYVILTCYCDYTYIYTSRKVRTCIQEQNTVYCI